MKQPRKTKNMPRGATVVQWQANPCEGCGLPVDDTGMCTKGRLRCPVCRTRVLDDGYCVGCEWHVWETDVPPR